jgi:hypothetical protein
MLGIGDGTFTRKKNRASILKRGHGRQEGAFLKAPPATLAPTPPGSPSTVASTSLKASG